MEVKTWKLFTAFLCCVGSFLVLSRAQETGTIVPLFEFVKFGHFFVLNCTSNNSSCDIENNSSHPHDYFKPGATWKAFTFIVVYWSLHASCLVTCNNDVVPESSPRIVTVYQPPQKIELDPVPEMEVGKQYNLTCRVSGVAPIRNLTVTLLKGKEQLLVKTFKDHTQPEADTVVVNHSIIAEEDDYGKTIICQTSLDLSPRGPLLKHTSHGISIGATTGAPEEMTLELQKTSPGQSWVYNLICHLTRVNPCLNLTVTFFKGSKQLGAPSFTNCTWVEVEGNYTAILPVTLHPEDHGQEAYCQAVVHFGLQKPVFQTKSSEVSLKTDESYMAIIVAATAVAGLLVCVLVVFLIFIVKLWIN
ncbi:intercellular adhesion molecule 1-like [Erythrolamprus reginae]|uniref:intercellular adhesion molecule 1-like n=1 Tax=Erythrolamprus reginae TaxID=121349 RepID=UPI00396CD0C0